MQKSPHMKLPKSPSSGDEAIQDKNVKVKSVPKLTQSNLIASFRANNSMSSVRLLKASR